VNRYFSIHSLYFSLRENNFHFHFQVWFLMGKLCFSTAMERKFGYKVVMGEKKKKEKEKEKGEKEKKRKKKETEKEKRNRKGKGKWKGKD